LPRTKGHCGKGRKKEVNKLSRRSKETRERKGKKKQEARREKAEGIHGRKRGAEQVGETAIGGRGGEKSHSLKKTRIKRWGGEKRALEGRASQVGQKGVFDRR